MLFILGNIFIENSTKQCWFVAVNKLLKKFYRFSHFRYWWYWRLEYDRYLFITVTQAYNKYINMNIVQRNISLIISANSEESWSTIQRSRYCYLGEDRKHVIVWTLSPEYSSLLQNHPPFLCSLWYHMTSLLYRLRFD